MRASLGVIVTIGLAACSQPAPPAASTPPVVAATPIAIDLVFTEDAAAKLIELGEAVIVSAYYYGAPKPGVDAGDDQILELGFEEQEIAPGPQQVTLAGVWDQSKAGDIAGEPMLNVNVYSARKAAPDNLIDCSLVDDTIATVAARSNPIVCKLIGT